MSDGGKEERLVTVKNAIDFSIVGDNILDIADFTVEKYEFRNDSYSRSRGARGSD